MNLQLRDSSYLSARNILEPVKQVNAFRSDASEKDVVDVHLELFPNGSSRSRVDVDDNP